MNPIEERAGRIRERIRRACESCGRDPRSVELLPVSKRQPASLIRSAAGLGFRVFGENYVQEGAGKAQELPDLSFVLIGPLQRNKARLALTAFSEIMTVDRPELAARLAALAEELGVSRKVWIQVDLWEETTKVGGCPGPEVEPLLRRIAESPRLDLQGFMAIPPPHESKAFHELAVFRDRLRQSTGRDLRLSMGMSDDLEAAIHAGSDQVRIGTAFFGERPSPSAPAQF
jgi:hypothetical protein